MNLKKIIALLLALCLLVFACACGGDKDPDPVDPNGNTDINNQGNNDPEPDDSEFVVSTEEQEQFVEVGEKTKLRWDISPEGYTGQVRVVSLDESVITVDNEGNCEGLKEGVSIIRVELQNSCVEFLAVVVDPNGGSSGGGHDMSKDYLELVSNEVVTLAPGQTSQIKVNAKYDGNTNPKLIYEGGTKGIASVDSNGLIKAEGLGTTAVEVGLEDRSRSCMIIVYVDGIKMDASLKDPKEYYAARDYVDVYINKAYFQQGKVSTVNGLTADDLTLVIDNGPTGVLELGKGYFKVVKEYTGEITFHFESEGARSNSLTIKVQPD